MPLDGIEECRAGCTATDPALSDDLPAPALGAIIHSRGYRAVGIALMPERFQLCTGLLRRFPRRVLDEGSLSTAR
jgi:hypothetical protein